MSVYFKKTTICTKYKNPNYVVSINKNKYKIGLLLWSPIKLTYYKKIDAFNHFSSILGILKVFKFHIVLIVY